MSLLHDQCQARLHWGKAGWPQLEPCYDGSKHLPETWCQFGCAIQVTLHLLTALEHVILPVCAMVQITEQVTLHSLIAPEYIADLCCKLQDVSMQSTAMHTDYIMFHFMFEVEVAVVPAGAGSTQQVCI